MSMAEFTSTYTKDELLTQSKYFKLYAGRITSSNEPVYIKELLNAPAPSKQTYQKQQKAFLRGGLCCGSQTTSNSSNLTSDQVDMFSRLSIDATREFSPSIKGMYHNQASASTFVVLEASPLGTLDEFLPTSKSHLDEPDALLVLKQLALAVQELHKNGVVHGAIRAENVLVFDRNFKLTCIASDESNNNMSISQSNFFQVPPEFNGSSQHTHTPAADIYCLGTLFNRLLTGSNSDSSQSSKPFPLLISAQATKLASRMTEANPQKRASIEEILRDSQLEMIRIIRNPQIDTAANRVDIACALSKSDSSGASTFGVFRESKSRNDVEGYLAEECYFGALSDANSKQFIRCKLISIPQMKLDEFVSEVSRFQEISSEFNDEDMQRIIDIVLMPQQQSQQQQSSAVSQSSSQSQHPQVVVVSEYSNQGRLSDYLAKRRISQNPPQMNISQAMHRIMNVMQRLAEKINCHGSLHVKNVYIDDESLRVGEPLFLRGSAQWITKQSVLDFVALECKNADQNLGGLQKADIWSFGALSYELQFGEAVIFDLQQKPIFPQSRITNTTARVQDIIKRCLIVPIQPRATWPEINRTMASEKSQFNYDTVPILSKKQAQLKQEQENPNNNNNNEMNRPNKQQWISMNPNATPKRDTLYSEFTSPNNENDSDFDRSAIGMNTSVHQYDGMNNPNDTSGLLQIPTNTLNPNNDTVVDVTPFDQNEREQLNRDKKYMENKVIVEKPQHQQLLANPKHLLMNDAFQTQAKPKLVAVEGEQELIKAKNAFKILVFLILFILVLFRSSLWNAWLMILNRGDFKKITIQTVSSSNGITKSTFEILTQDLDPFLMGSVDMTDMLSRYSCISNTIFTSASTSNVYSSIRSTSFFFWCLASLLSAITIITLRILHVIRADIRTIGENYQRVNVRNAKLLLYVHVLTYMEFAFLYYSHYTIFNYFYYSELNPCFGNEMGYNANAGISATSAAAGQLVPMLQDSSKFLLSSQIGDFIMNIGCSVGIVGLLVMVGVSFYVHNPLDYTNHFAHPLHQGARVFLYVFGCWVTCRIGAFLIYEPSISFDSASIMSKLLGNADASAFFGFIPELFEIILIVIDVIFEAVFYQVSIARDKKAEEQKKRIGAYRNERREQILKQNQDLAKNGFGTNQNISQSNNNNKLSVSHAALSVYSKRSKK